MAEGRKFILTGRTADADTTLEVGPIARGTFPTIAYVASTVSTDNTNDIAAGTGALTATIRGLNATFFEKEETVTMTGTSAVLTTLTFVRINEVRVNTCGTALGNTGTITTSLNSQAHATVPIAYSRSNGLFYSVPTDHHLRIDSLAITGAEYATTEVIRVRLEVKRIALAAGRPWETLAELDIPFGGSRGANLRGPIYIPGAYDVRVFVATATNNRIVSGTLVGEQIFGPAPHNTLR